MMELMSRRFMVYVVLVVGGVAGCSPRATDGGFDSENPAARLYAIQQSGAAKDREAIPQLIEALDSDDAAVRMLSIRALQEMTGERRGYSPYDPPQKRNEAVKRWVAAYESGELADDGDGMRP